MRALSCAAAIVFAGGTAQAQPGALQCRADAPAVRDIRAVADGIVSADNRRDIEAVLALYAPDAVLMPPGEPPVVGRERIRPRYEALFADFAPEIVPYIDEVCASAGVGFVRGRNGGRLVPRGSAPPRTLDDGYLMLLRREDTGAWRISHLIWHRQSSPTKPGP
jgi:uncharacterized protein (TIGR02246 family)